MISIKNIKIPFNYVLLKLDKNFDTYQFGGKETNIIAPTYDYQGEDRVDTSHTNYATTGTVYGVPDKIRFTREAIKKIKASIVTERNGLEVMADSSLLYKIHALKASGCRYETENELAVGDHVKIAYQVHMRAQFFETEDGEMCFVKYDDIFMTTDGKMVNGFILIDPMLQDTKQEGAISYEESASGLMLPKLRETYKRSARWQHGTVLHAGKPIKGYFDLADYFDEDVEVLPGDKLIFDPRTALRYEMDTHMALADHRLYLIQRKDILFMEKDNVDYEKLCTI